MCFLKKTLIKKIGILLSHKMLALLLFLHESMCFEDASESSLFLSRSTALVNFYVYKNSMSTNQYIFKLLFITLNLSLLFWNIKVNNNNQQIILIFAMCLEEHSHQHLSLDNHLLHSSIDNTMIKISASFFLQEEIFILLTWINLHDLINDNPISCIKNFATDFFTVITIICISHYFIFPHLSIVSML